MKKIWSLFLAAAMLVSVCAAPAFSASAEGAGKVGDANGDGLVNLQDVLLIQKYLANIVPEEEIDLTAANVNREGGVNMQDVLMMQQYLAGIIEGFPQQEVRFTFDVTIPDPLPEGAYVSMGCSLNGWNPADTAWYAEKIDGTHYRLSKTLDESVVGTVMEYKWTVQMPEQTSMWAQVEGAAQGGDIDNRKVTIKAGDQSFNDKVAMFRDLGSLSTITGGKMEMHEFNMTQYEDNRVRKIRVWTPEGYDPADTTKRYPVMYMHDGQNVFDAYTSFAGEWEVDEAVTQMISEGYEGTIVVGVDNGPDRTNELCPPWPRNEYGAGTIPNPTGDKYASFIVDTVKPYVDAHYNTRPERGSTGIGGSSMGGLISFYMAVEYPDVFSYALCFSPAFQMFEDDTLRQAAEKFDTSDPGLLPKIYLYSGGKDFEAEFMPYVGFMHDALIAHGYPAEKIDTLVDPTQLHTESAWAKYFPGAYRWLVDFEPAAG